MQAAARLWLLAALPALTGNVSWVAVGEVVSAAGVGAAGGAGPAFAPRQQTSVLAATGQSAELDCRVMRLGDKAVSWVRSRDLQILAHAGAVFTADTRVSAAESGSGGGVSSHALRIARLRAPDAGRYECQVNTDPKLSLFFNLTVLDERAPRPVVSALGPRAVSGALGGSAELACEARYEPEPRALPAPPLTLRWRRLGPDPRPLQARGGGVSLETERWGAARLVSRLTLAGLRAGDAGLYRCAAGDAGDDGDAGDADTVSLRIHGQEDAEAAEAMQRDQSAPSGGGGGGAQGPRELTPVLVTVLIALAALVNR